MTNKFLQACQALWVPLSLLCLFSVAVLFRPLLPIDETRYMSAAWEMHIRGDWLAPLTVNFQPYHHKPPLLLWLINLSWSIFGVGRTAGTVPVVVMAGLSVMLTQILSRQLFPARLQNQTVPFLMMGSLPFLAYSTLVMFDITLSVFVLTTLVLLIAYVKDNNKWFIPLMALAIGFGVLTKGPVAWLYIIFPMLLGPLWNDRTHNKMKWYGACGTALLLSLIPVLLWLVPVLHASSNNFAFWLLWEQTAGRITGNFGAAHVRPVYFYLPLIPVLFAPWLFFPSFWRTAKSLPSKIKAEYGYRFLICWLVPVFLTFSLISGKQPHYLLPLLPGVVILISTLITSSLKKIALVAISMSLMTMAGQMIAAQTVFKNYDLQPVSDYVRAHPHHDWAAVPKYQGEVTFLGRLDHSVDAVPTNALEKWFLDHPNGLAMIRYSDPSEVKDFTMLFDMPYRSRRLGIFSNNPGSSGRL